MKLGDRMGKNNLSSPRPSESGAVGSTFGDPQCHGTTGRGPSKQSLTTSHATCRGPALPSLLVA